MRPQRTTWLTWALAPRRCSATCPVWPRAPRPRWRLASLAWVWTSSAEFSTSLRTLYRDATCSQFTPPTVKLDISLQHLIEIWIKLIAKLNCFERKDTSAKNKLLFLGLVPQVDLKILNKSVFFKTSLYIFLQRVLAFPVNCCLLVNLQTWAQTVWAAPWARCPSRLPARTTLMCLLRPGPVFCLHLHQTGESRSLLLNLLNSQLLLLSPIISLHVSETEFFIFHAGRCWSETFPFGMNDCFAEYLNSLCENWINCQLRSFFYWPKILF